MAIDQLEIQGLTLLELANLQAELGDYVSRPESTVDDSSTHREPVLTIALISLSAGAIATLALYLSKRKAKRVTTLQFFHRKGNEETEIRLDFLAEEETPPPKEIAESIANATGQPVNSAIEALLKLTGQ